MMNGIDSMATLLSACGYKAFHIVVTPHQLQDMMDESGCASKEELENILNTKIEVRDERTKN